LLPFAKVSRDAGVELISTGGTAKALRDGGLKVIELSEYTGFSEMLDGRVKTLHPKIHVVYCLFGTILRTWLRCGSTDQADRSGGRKSLSFEQTVARPGVKLDEAIENIDIGGPSMLRSAAKNHDDVTVVVDPADYDEVAAQIKTRGEKRPWNCVANLPRECSLAPALMMAPSRRIWPKRFEAAALARRRESASQNHYR